MTWISLIFAGLFEVVGVVGMSLVNQNRFVRSYLVLVVGFSLSFALLSYAMTGIAMGTAYAVWTGIGTVGSTVVGMLVYGESRGIMRLFCIALIVCSVIGLKLLG